MATQTISSMKFPRRISTVIFAKPRMIASIALLAIALASGCAKGPDDAALIAGIKSQMASDVALGDATLQVTSQKGVVTLSGTVRSDAARLDAYKIATQTQGVKKVNDEMTVEAAQPAPVQEESASAKSPASVSKPAHPRAGRAGKDSGPMMPQQPKDAPQPTSEPPQPASPPQIPAADQPVAAALPVPVAAPTPPPPPPQPKDVLIPANTTMTIRMIDGVDSAVNHAGEIFHASLETPILVGGEAVAPRGADVYVRLASAKQAGHLEGKAELKLELVKLEFQGRSYPLVSGTYYLSGDSRGKDTAKKVGAGAAIGGIIGAIAGRGAGAAIGAAVGAGAGGVYQESTKGKKVKVPSETKLDFLLEQPVTVTVMPHAPTPE
jgi:hypothetical protein